MNGTMLIFVDNQGYVYEPVSKILKQQGYAGDFARAATESDTIGVMRLARNKRILIVTDSLTASKYRGERTIGTQMLISNARKLRPECGIIVHSSDFFGLDEKYPDGTVDFILSSQQDSLETLCAKIHAHAKAS
jgi:hypothetical protein